MAKENLVDSVANALESIPALLTALEKTLQTPFGWVVLVGILAWFAFNKDILILFRLNEEKQKKRLESLESYLKDSENSETLTRKVITEFRNSYYFKVATDIYAEEKRRQSLINLYEKTSASVTWTTIKRALPYLVTRSENEIIVRDIKKWDWLGKYYNLFVGWLTLAFAASIFIVMLTIANKSLISFISFMGISIFLIGFAVFAFAQNLPLNAAIKIKRELKLESNKENDN